MTPPDQATKIITSKGSGVPSSEPRLAYARVREGRKSRDGRAARDWARPS